MSTPVKDHRLAVECPNCEQTLRVETGDTIEATVTAHDEQCPGQPVGRRSAMRRIDCPDCGRHLGDVGPNGDQGQIERLHALHTCTPKTPRPAKGPAMTAPIPPAAPPGQSACPPAQTLLTHPSKRIARQAAKVIAEHAKLAEAWKADAGNARIREQIATHEAEIKALRAKLRQPGPKPKATSS